jgi:predicted MFS family arabinose efflux permease
MLQVAAAIAAITGGILASWSFAFVMWLSVIPQLICLVLSFMIIEPKIHVYESGNVYLHLREAISNFIHNKKLRLLSIASIITFGIGESTYTFRSAFFGALWPIWAIGIARSLSGFGAAISFHFSGRIIKKYSHLKILLFGFIYSRIINIVFTLFPSLFSPVGMSSTSLNYGVTTVAENSLMQKEFTDKQRATMESLNSLGGNLFYAVFAFVLGFVADKLTPGQALLFSQILILPVVLIYWKLFKGDKTRVS